MNKALALLLFILSIVSINSEFSGCEEVTSAELKALEDDSDRADFCRVHSLGEDYTHCCYYESEKVPDGQCIQITDDAYENIKRYKKFKKNFDSDIKIKCSSKFLTYSAFVLLALFF